MTTCVTVLKKIMITREKVKRIRSLKYSECIFITSKIHSLQQGTFDQLGIQHLLDLIKILLINDHCKACIVDRPCQFIGKKWNHTKQLTWSLSSNNLYIVLFKMQWVPCSMQTFIAYGLQLISPIL